SRPRPPPPPFPTRRSSDLETSPARPGTRTIGSAGDVTPEGEPDDHRPRPILDSDPPAAADTPADRMAAMLGRGVGCHVSIHVDRSEEHTSELQSRENLVCR